MELIYYLFILIIALIFSIKKELIQNKNIFFIFWISLYILLSIIIRINLSEKSGDIYSYSLAMEDGKFLITPSNFYYLKEPIVWYGQRILYAIVQSSKLVFFISDLLIGIVLFSALKIFKLPQYIYFSILLFFPFITGMQNIYRQFYSSIFFLYTLANIWEGKAIFKIYGSFLLSFLSHNIAAIFLPIIFIKSKRFAGKINFLLAFIIGSGGLFFASYTRTATSTDSGGEFGIAYIFLIISFSILILIVDKGIIKNSRRNDHKLIITLASISIISLFTLGDSGSERISIFCLLIIYPLLAKIIEEKVHQKIVPRIAFTIMGFAPALIFASTRIRII